MAPDSAIRAVLATNTDASLISAINPPVYLIAYRGIASPAPLHPTWPEASRKMPQKQVLRIGAQLGDCVSITVAQLDKYKERHARLTQARKDKCHLDNVTFLNVGFLVRRINLDPVIPRNWESQKWT